MINVTIVRRSADRYIESFVVEGHAQYSKRGKDIVCAGVSAVTVGTVNAVESVLGIRLNGEMKDGWIQVRVQDDIELQRREQVQLILESMVVMLITIQSSYPNYIRISGQ